MKTFTVKFLLLLSVVMMLLLIIGHALSYLGINIDHYRMFNAPFILFFPVILVSVIVKRGNFFMNLKNVPVLLILSIVPLVVYLVILLQHSVEYDEEFSGVADIIHGEYVIHNHGVVQKKIGRNRYNEIRSHNNRLITSGVFLFYYVVLLCLFIESKKNGYD